MEDGASRERSGLESRRPAARGPSPKVAKVETRFTLANLHGLKLRLSTSCSPISFGRSKADVGWSTTPAFRLSRTSVAALGYGLGFRKARGVKGCFCCS